ncbi:MAG TPA: hypothetical protein VFQ63_00115 [Patescibacteria group bacterium]|nr:hypothetical protein [Patescibacteria group bacterium]
METQQIIDRHSGSPDALWSAIKKVHPQSEVVHPEKLGQGPVVNALFTFCPLYAQGSLQESGLIYEPAPIEDSRVAGKWEAVKNVVVALSDELKHQGKSLSLTVVLADKGVLLNHEPTAEDQAALTYHAGLYKEALEEVCEENGIDLQFLRFQDEGVDVHFPSFVNPSAPIPNVARPEGFDRRGVADVEDPATMLALIKDYMESLGVDSLPVINKKMRATIKDLISAFGPQTTFWMVAGYLAFDYKIPELLGEGGLYISAERFPPIFRIARLTPDLNDMARVEVKA